MNTEDFIASVFEQAVAERASDVHFEPMVSSMRVRFRVDGILEDRYNLPAYQLESIINSVKVLASLDITAHEVPQDGHFEFYQVPVASKEAGSGNGEEHLGIGARLKAVFAKADSVPSIVKERQDNVSGGSNKKGTRVLDVRVSIYPSINGEVLVARILDRSDAVMSLNDLGMTPETLATVKNLISYDSGLVVITGPAGSGKTTTLYSILQELKSQEKNIMTIEDPVEFHLEWLRQSELKIERGFTFIRAMRSILRQDPDVIMIGEIRDQEAAEHAISVSLIGHIVGTTMHSNSMIGTVARFVDMNIERSMIAYAINGIISRRLVRKVCPSCVVEYEPDDEHLNHFGLSRGSHKFVRGQGCENCRHTGYLGRIGIFEVLEFDGEFRSLIVAKAPMSELEAYTVKVGMKTLKDDALAKAIAGITTLEEISKVV